MHGHPSTSFYRSVARGAGASLSIAAGYLPIAFSFGLAAMQAGLPAWAIVLTSIVVYAGASQFVLIALLASGAGWLVAVPTILLMNARHLFYGPALLSRLPRRGAGLPAPLLAFGLTDEVFATALSRLNAVPEASRPGWYVGLQIGAYASWVGGTVLGVTLSSRFQDLPRFAEAALSFILPGLFFALLLEAGVARSARTIAVTVAACLLLLTVLPSYHALALGILIGATFTMIEVARTNHA